MRILRAVLPLVLTLGWSLTAAGQSTSTFAGNLVRRDSSPVITAKIKLPVLERTATTDTLGHFQLNNVPAGRHQVTVWAPRPRVGWRDSSSAGVAATACS